MTDIQAEILQLISERQAWHYGIVPYSVEQDTIYLYTAAQDHHLQKELEFLTGKNVIFSLIKPSDLQEMLGKYYRRAETAKGPSVSMFGGVERDQDFLEALILEARQLGSSDIHLEHYDERCRIRFRIDGLLIERYIIPVEKYPALINKIKIKANLDISEKRLPQDGRIFFEAQGSKFDIRVSSLPTLYGEKIVMRLLSGNETRINLNNLGFEAQDLEHFLEGVDKPNGMVLISGPTGSGKTTTLYATLQRLNSKSRNILTIEDPIEYTLEGINQVQLKESIGLDFTSALRTFLRQDPDIIMVGEIRDANTASMAIRASLTGHLVLSTIHTNSAWGIIARLIDMGIPPYLLADTLNVAVAQRLLRLLCPHCKQEINWDDLNFPRNYKPSVQSGKVYHPTTGCEYCFYTGYKGRKAVYEVIPIDEALSEMIRSKTMNIKDYLIQKKYKTLSDNAFSIFLSGETSLHEIFPVLSSQY